MNARVGKLGISGFGSIGRKHANVAVGAGWDLVIFDPEELSAGTLAALPETTIVVRSFEELFGHGIDALIIATPDVAHAGQAITSCERGVPVLVEKPLADSVVAGRSIKESSRRTGTPVLCGYVVRQSDAMREALRMLTSGELGTVASFHVDLGAYETLEAARNRFGPSDHDHLYFDYSHEWDYLQWFFGPAIRVLAVARTVEGLPLVQPPNVIDAMLELEGAFGTVHLDYVQHPPRRRMSVIGSLASVEVDVLAATLTVFERAAGSTRVEHFDQGRDDLLLSQLENLAAVARGEEQPFVGALDGIRALEVAEALVSSARYQQWVEVRPRH